MAVFALGLPAAAYAASPVVETIDAYSTSATTASLDFSVNPGGDQTTYVVQYDTGESQWCTNDGFSGTPANTTSPPVQINFTDTDFHPVTANLTGLTAGQDYCGQVVATNADGTYPPPGGAGVVFWTQGVPVAFTYFGVTSTSATTASVAGQVNPSGQDTNYYANWDTATSDFCTGGPNPNPSTNSPGTDLGQSDSIFHNVSVDLSGLVAGTQYCAEIFAKNASGTSQDSGTVFWTQGEPTAETFNVNPTGADTATLDGYVDPAGQSTAITFQYDTQSSDFCTSDGSSTDGTTTTTATLQTLTPSDPAQQLTEQLTGLVPGTQYCGQIVASNSTDTVYGGTVDWTQGLPQAFTESINSTGGATAEVAGDVIPTSQATTYFVQYDAQSSSFCMSGGQGTPANSTTPQDLAQMDNLSHPVTVDLSSLTPGAKYCGQVVAQNAAGFSYGGTVDWTQGIPQTFTIDVTSTGASTATVTGSVNPTGDGTTTYAVQYDTQSSNFCTSFGSTTDGTTTTTTAQPLNQSDNTFHNVSVDLTSGLTAGQSYCAQVVATNAAGMSSSAFNTVGWTQGTPSVETDSAGSTAATTATVTGFVNPAGQSTTYAAQWGLASDTWCQSGGINGSPLGTTTPAVSLPFTDTSPHSVSVDLTGLTAGTTYCAQLIATNGAGESFGGTSGPWTEGLPTAFTEDAQQTGDTTANVDGTVNPSGQTTTYNVQWDLANTSWCENQGATGTPTNTTTDQPLGFTDTSDHDVTVGLTGLTNGTAYCAQLVSKNASGTADGGFVTWTQGTPIAVTADAVSTSQTAANVDGTVNPNGLSTQYYVEWDSGNSLWCQTIGGLGNPANSTTPQALGATDGTAHNVTVGLTGLTAGTSYCALLVATNSAGTESQFLGIVYWTEGAPLVVTSGVNPTSSTAATVSGTVNPIGASGTQYQVYWDLASSQWCSSSGFLGGPTNMTALTALGFSDSTAHNVTVGLSGLTANTDYCAELVATNASGTTEGMPLIGWTQSTVPQQQLSVSLTGGGSGSVSSSPAGINDCTTSLCTANFDQGTQVTLTATADPGSVFTGWSGGGCSGTSTCQVTLNADVSVTATFKTTDTLTVDRSGTGTGTVTSTPAGINCGNTCSAPFADASQVTLHAAGDPGSAFTGWSGGGCSGTGDCVVNLSGDTTVTATFATSHTLTVTKAGTGTGTVTSGPAGINCGATCSAPFADGTQVTLTAASTAGSSFTGWSGGGCSGTSTCQVTLSADTTVTATFTTIPVTVQCIVPNVKGKSLSAAKRAITAAHCAVGKVTMAKSKKVAKGKVISQKPAAGKHLAKGSKVNLVVSRGKH